MAVLIVAAAAAAGPALAAPLTIRFIDVGQGDATAFQGPCGQIGILDVAKGGASAVLHALDAFGSRRVRWLAVSHFDADHVGGVGVLGTSPQVRIGTVYDRGVPDDPAPTYRAYATWARSSRHPLRHLRLRDRFSLCSGSDRVKFDVISVAAGRTAVAGLRVSAENDRGVCLKITYIRFKMAACGDASARLERAVAALIGKVTLAKIDHHGSRGSSDPAYVNALDPIIAVVSVGKNSYGHPNQDVLRLWESHAVVYETAASDGVAEDGDVIVTTNGTRWAVVRTTVSQIRTSYRLPAPAHMTGGDTMLVTAVATLSSTDGVVLLIVVLAGSLLAGLVVILGRRLLGQGSDGAQSLVRSWLAISLVLGLLAFCAAAFWIDDQQLRSALVGGLVASAGAATAFYFSSKSADQARADILSAATTLAKVPAPPTHFSSPSPPAATNGVAYTYIFVADGTPPLTYGVGGGQLPIGLTLEPDGTLHGTPSASGIWAFSVIVKNALGSHSTDQIELVVNDQAAPSTPA